MFNFNFQKEKQTKNFNHIILSSPHASARNNSMKQHGDTFYYMEMFSWKEEDPSTRTILATYVFCIQR